MSLGKSNEPDFIDVPSIRRSEQGKPKNKKKKKNRYSVSVKTYKNTLKVISVISVIILVSVIIFAAYYGVSSYLS